MSVVLEAPSFTQAGRPVLAPGEQQLAVVSPAELQSEGHLGAARSAAGCKEGHCVLTTARVLWCESGAHAGDAKRSCSIPVAVIRSVATASGMMSKMGFSPVVKLQLVIGVDAQRRAVSAARDTVNVLLKSTDLKGAEAFKLRLRSLLSAPAAARAPLADATHLGTLPHALVRQASRPLANEQLLEMLTVMGFAGSRARAALLQTGNNLEAAVQWLFDNAQRSDEALEHELAQHLQHAASIHSHPVRDASLPVSPPTSPPSEASTHPPSSGPGSARIPSGPLEAAAMANPLRGAGAASAGPRAPPQPPPPRMIGLGGIIRKEQEAAQAQSSSVRQAFQDLQALMNKGESMVQLAQELRSKLASQPAAEGAGDGDATMDPAVEQELIDLGIWSPVTRRLSGKRFEEDLARELADFLHQPLRRTGGMMTLHDVFCLFNRARGTELVSPDDLKAAAGLCQKLSLAVQLRLFPSGVAVMQDASFSDDSTCHKLLNLVTESAGEAAQGLGRGLTATQIAGELLLPIAVAMEQLLLAERRGVLCRDDGPEGLIFYRNVFADAAMSAV